MITKTFPPFNSGVATAGDSDIDKKLDKLFGPDLKMKEVFRQIFTGKVDDDKLKELKEKREKEIAYINEKFELSEPILS